MTGPVVGAEHVSKWYGEVIGLNDVSVAEVTAAIQQRLGPSQTSC